MNLVILDTKGFVTGFMTGSYTEADKPEGTTIVNEPVGLESIGKKLVKGILTIDKNYDAKKYQPYVAPTTSEETTPK